MPCLDAAMLLRKACSQGMSRANAPCATPPPPQQARAPAAAPPGAQPENATGHPARAAGGEASALQAVLPQSRAAAKGYFNRFDEKDLAAIEAKGHAALGEKWSKELHSLHAMLRRALQMHRTRPEAL